MGDVGVIVTKEASSASDLFPTNAEITGKIKTKERSGDIIARPTALLQFSSEMQQTL
jgi:hypothetical protein